MKKILTLFMLVSIFAIFVESVTLAAPSTSLCSPQVIEPKQKKIDWNDYLWLSVQEHDNVKSGRQQGSAAVCGKGHGTKDYCTDGQRIEMKPGHVWRGTPINKTVIYVCTTSGDDRWEIYVPEEKKCSTMVQSGKPLSLSAGETFNMDLTREMCADALKRADGDAGAYARASKLDLRGGTFQLYCDSNVHLQCKLKACEGNYVVSGEKCVERNPGPTPNPNKDTCSATIKGQTVVLNRGAESSIDLTAAECSAAVKVAHGGGLMDQNGIYHFFCGPTCKKVGCKQGYENDENGMCVKKGGDKKTCRERRAGMSIEAIACCDTGADAVWDSPIKGKCNCKDSNTHFEIVGGRGQCVANITPPPVIIPPVIPQPCSDPDNMDSNCKCIVAGTVERGGKCVCRDDNQEIKNGKCEWTAKYVAGLESDLDSKFNGLTATIGGFEKNVWRDENGEFNTARLASDSIAGVVLGTVGGIVTANLVKKAQVKQGFEDIGCYIGGQSVAGFGDEFNVGR
ncbi:MAG: hypothetical protein IJL21_04555 [Alphaproteobacteria bacterium]|nr:hypothetical protein [Alphaproteobacteria bacterium]